MGPSRRTTGDIRHARSPQLALLALAAASILGTAATPAAGADRFTCRASAIRVTGLAGVGLPEAEPAVANAANDPCTAATTTIASSPPALATVLSTGTASATTTVDASSATAEAELADPSVLGLVLGGVSIDELSASAGYTCVAGQPVAESDSQVTGLTALGQPPVTTDQPQQLHYGGLADVTLNDTVTTATSVTRRAVTLDLLPILLGGVEIVLGEARAGVSGNPCPPLPDPAPDPDPTPTPDPTPPTSDPAPPAGDPTPISQSPATVATTATAASPAAASALAPAPRCTATRRARIACAARRVVGKIRSRSVIVGGMRVFVRALVPSRVHGSTKLRFVVKPARRHVLRRARFRLGGRALHQRVRSVGLTASQLSGSSTHMLSVRLVPRRGRAVTVRIRFRTTQI